MSLKPTIVLDKMAPLPLINPHPVQLFKKPLIFIPKGDTIRIVLDTQHSNSNTDQSFESWPIEPLVPQLARADKNFTFAIDHMYAYAHAPFDEETISHTSFLSGDKL